MMRNVITAVIVTSDTVCDPKAFRVAIADGGAAGYVTVETDGNEISIDTDEWPALRRAINRMVRIAKEPLE